MSKGKTEWWAVKDDDGWSVIYDVGESLTAIVAEDLDKATAHRIAAVNEMEAALEWALPLAEMALEECKLSRLKAGHHDIGQEEGHPGLWPDEIKKRDDARAALAKARGE